MKSGVRTVKLIIDIPEAFEGHFNQDRFKDSLERLLEDAHSLAGNYEIETAEMLIKAFESSKTISEWLSLFNTESAPKCFEAVQKLKMEVEADANSN